MAVVVFDPAAFVATYPEFTGVDPARLTSMFTVAEQSILDNTDNSPVMDINVRTQLFYLLVGHLLLIFGIAPTSPDNTPPGRLSSATEGTITTAFEYIMPAGSGLAPWFLQTKYGAMYWMMTAPYRSALYIANGSSGIGAAIAYGSTIPSLPNGL
jgi:hypothetical protein